MFHCFKVIIVMNNLTADGQYKITRNKRWPVLAGRKGNNGIWERIKGLLT